MVNNDKVLSILLQIGEKIEEEKLFLTELDNVIGDGDHGINMARGFDAVKAKQPMMEGKDVGTILKTVGMALVSTVGGASGPLYGTAFMRAGMAAKGKDELSAEDISAMLQAAIDGIVARGKATVGEKTMLDAIIPAKEVYDAAIADGKSIAEALAAAEEKAWERVEYTKTIIATKGRASYLGERSIGHQDPGATSMSYLIQSMKEVAEA